MHTPDSPHKRRRVISLSAEERSLLRKSLRDSIESQPHTTEYNRMQEHAHTLLQNSLEALYKKLEDKE